ncbi:hypothetical protein [uncultured Polaribacter sp.]|uniref:hypothetical protein n=1 Tax=uncultured Polaribacter sp. TaxID=174711 RepID=UPI00261C5A35|nr:hypothetical protein [uncultured Polaribacter sp.]
MQKCFYLICPTDFLENTINKKFNFENYFYSSLGNSFNYDCKTITYIKNLIEKHNIKEIYFVLSLDNKIILDAIGKQRFSNIKVLGNFYNEIIKEEGQSKKLFQERNSQFSILSYYLNKKIKELKTQLVNTSNLSIKIGGKIYNKDKNTFTNIYSDLVCLKKHQLN